MTVSNVANSAGFSAYAQTMMNRRGISAEQREQFADIHEQFESQSTSINAKDYIASLSDGDLEILRKVHSLADKIRPDELSLEGALNLLNQPGDVQDLNDDAIVEVGKAKTFVFPPPNAPQNVKDAWEETTANMSDKEKMLLTFKFMTQIMTANLHKQGDTYVFTQPGEEGYVNPYSAGTSYKGVVNDMLYDLERMKKYMPAEKYESDKQLLTAFADALEKNGAC